MKYVLIFIGLIVLAFISFNVIAGILGADTNDEALVGIIVLAMQNTAIITFLIYLVSKQNKK
ncbi:hypothetical protein [Psychrobacillus sp.]|uniref:hypothetical protein n=1 Tax=Psychrobacillus sp. TaxID=1871623 RepID=UPI0028BD7A16|nr:hypothetical protein [Psychrobacillus sp.]